MTLMRDETLASAACTAAFLEHGLGAAMAAGQALRQRAPRQLEVLGRGSSSHAGTVLRYAFASQGGLGVSAVMPSVAANPSGLAHLQDAAVLAISQSGRSPDLVRYAVAARSAGALVVGLVNTSGSPLGAASDHQIALCAGPELAVAATKSVILSVIAGLAVVAGFRQDTALVKALGHLPDRLDGAAACDWSALSKLLPGCQALYVVGRGVDLGIAKELALKVAEAAGIPALAFSSAEFLHGPLGAVSARTPVVGIASDAQALASVQVALQRAQAQGATTLLAHGLAHLAGVSRAQLPLPDASGTVSDVVLTLVPAYLAIEAAALALGRNPDKPQGLAKVTETL